MSDEPHPLGVALQALNAHGHKTCAEALVEHCADLYDTAAALRAELERMRGALEDIRDDIEASPNDFAVGRATRALQPSSTGKEGADLAPPGDGG
jgi:phage shock protein A